MTIKRERITAPIFETVLDTPDKLYMKLAIRHLGRYYANEADHGTWGITTDGTKQVPYQVGSARKALEVMEQFTFPADLRVQAMRASSKLARVFENVARLQTHRNLTSGRLDSRKFTKIAKELAHGTYDPDQVRPYKRTFQTPVDPPKIAIVASGAWGEMWDDDKYVPMVTILSLSLAWACEACGLRVLAALVQGSFRQKGSVLGYILADSGTVTSLVDYAPLFHRDMFRMGLVNAGEADVQTLTRVMKMQGSRYYVGAAGSFWSSLNGGQGVAWAKAQGTDVVIALGEIEDRQQADAYLPGIASVEQAVDEIVKQVTHKYGK